MVNECERISTEVARIPDPELPLSIGELGIVRDVQVDADAGHVRVQLTPTYNGCPANAAIRESVRAKLTALGYTAEVEKVLSPAWTSDCITAEGRAKLRAAGIAPPQDSDADALFAAPTVACIRCGSARTTRVSNFGATLCKALYRCDDCREPFEYFKCLK